MKVSLAWLKDYVSFGLSSDKLAHRLTMAGLEVEKVETVDGDTVFELEITPNRPDCLNMLGIGREVSAIFNAKLKYPKIRKYKDPRDLCDIKILDREGCARYIGTVVTDVNVGKSPDWMRKRLTAIGLRPINNVVDITNFCLMETGQPLHAFDYDKLEGGKIVVRRARKGEKIVTLDGIERELNPDILVIADAKQPVAIAGVMGGEGTEVSEKTRTILLESAYFDPYLVRRATRNLGISTDSSYRFERCVDIHMVQGGAARAIALIRNESPQSVITSRQDLFLSKRKISKHKVSISKAQINQLLGAELTISQCKTILKKLEFQVRVEDRMVLHATAPSFRNDVQTSVDVIEEVARIIGYDNLPTSLPEIKISHIPSRIPLQAKKRMRRILSSQGFHESITYALVNQDSLIKTLLGNLPKIKVQNPLSLDQEIMRPHLLPGLLAVTLTNFNRGQRNVRLFEMGKVYSRQGEQETLALIMMGSRDEDWRQLKRDLVDFYDIKGTLTLIMEIFGINASWEPEENGLFATGNGANICWGKGQKLGIAGKIKKEILKNWDIKQDDVYFAQLALKPLFDHEQALQFKAISEYPAVTRDVSLAVKKGVLFAWAEKIAFQLGRDLLVDVQFREQYLGEKIANDQRGIIFTLTYQSSSRTLTEDEVQSVHDRICQAFVNQLGATIR